jgi:hypothetical protein
MRPSSSGYVQVVASLVCGLVGVSGCANSGVPRAQILEPVVDLPAVTRGVQLTHTFVLANQGTGVLRIEDVETGCFGSARLSGKTIAAGGSATIAAAFESRGSVTDRPTTFDMIVRTNDPVKPEINLSLRTTVLSEWKLSQSVVNLEDDAEAVAARAGPHTLTISMPPDRPVSLGQPRSTNEVISVGFDSARSTPGREYTLLVQVMTPPGASVRGNIVIPTSSTLTPEIRIPVIRLRR